MASLTSVDMSATWIRTSRFREEISGQRLWEGSLLLCNYLLEASRCKPGDERAELNVEGKAALELGAGTGVVSMLVHGLGASTVVATDGDERFVARVCAWGGEVMARLSAM